MHLERSGKDWIWKDVDALSALVKGWGKAKTDPRPSRLRILSKLLSCFPQYTFCLPHNIVIVFHEASFVLYYTYSSMDSVLYFNLPQNLHQVCLPVSIAYSRNKQVASFLMGKSWMFKRNEHTVFLSRFCLNSSSNSLLTPSVKPQGKAWSSIPFLRSRAWLVFFVVVSVGLCFGFVFFNKGCLADVS